MYTSSKTLTLNCLNLYLIGHSIAELWSQLTVYSSLEHDYSRSYTPITYLSYSFIDSKGWEVCTSLLNGICCWSGSSFQFSNIWLDLKLSISIYQWSGIFNLWYRYINRSYIIFYYVIQFERFTENVLTRKTPGEQPKHI